MSQAVELNIGLIHNEERAYMLGWIARVGERAPNALKHRDEVWIRECLGEYNSVQEASERLAIKQMPRWLQADTDLGWAFVRGYFDHHGHIGERDTPPVCKLFGEKEMLDSISEFAMIPTIRAGFGSDAKKPNNVPILVYKGVNAIDFLGKLYDKARVFWAKRRSQYIDLLTPDPRRVPHVFYTKTDERAVIPSKAHPSDVGYDLTIIAEHKKVNSVTTLYDTGIQVSVENGWYLEVVPRSSIVKSGYMLTNTMGVIDPSYQGNIYVALTKVDPDAPPIQLPYRGFQIVMRRQHHAIWVESSAKRDTVRQDGGFGSSGK